MGPASGNHWFDRTATLPETALRQGLLFSWFFGCLGIASGTREQVLTEAVELRLLRGGGPQRCQVLVRAGSSSLPVLRQETFACVFVASCENPRRSEAAMVGPRKCFVLAAKGRPSFSLLPRSANESVHMHTHSRTP